jgi:tetratricopeptide (TPR) repeat protein
MLKQQGLDQYDRRAAEVLAKVAMTEGNVTDAVQVLAKSHCDAELIQFLNNAGVKLSQGNDVSGAIRMYQQCLEVIRENEFVHAIYYNLGWAYSRIRDHSNAARCYQLAIEHKQDFVKARQALERLTA